MIHYLGTWALGHFGARFLQIPDLASLLELSVAYPLDLSSELRGPLSALSGRPCPCRAGQARSATLTEQAQCCILRAAHGGIWRHDRVKGHQGSRKGKVARHFLFYREPAGRG